ncbi:MAG: hypothetical protein IBX40_03630 [Methanosarcinales archaeon]|nr:hypothetical protein [Methanosarcinales archaeon]
MKKTYLEIGSSVGAVLVFIILIVIINDKNFSFHNIANFGNVAILVAFVIVIGFIGIKLAELTD